MLTTSFPKGVNANEANLKCCLAKGIPMMVTKRRIPNRTWVKLIHIPPTRIQMTLKMM
jgi:hypothetical protein